MRPRVAGCDGEVGPAVGSDLRRLGEVGPSRRNLVPAWMSGGGSRPNPTEPGQGGFCLNLEKCIDDDPCTTDSCDISTGVGVCSSSERREGCCVVLEGVSCDD